MRRFILCTALALAAAAERTPSRIETEVRHELVMLPYYGIFDDLAFRVDGTRVQLFGAVTRPALKVDAERAVKRIEGVAAVESPIQVLPLSPEDDRIRLAAYRAIYGQAALARYSLQAVPSIHIVVKNGHVTLRGVVDSLVDKNIANIQTHTVAGVFTVTNELEIQGHDKRNQP